MSEPIKLEGRQMTELEQAEEQRKLNEISGKPRHIEINERTIEAYRSEFSKKGLQVETSDYDSEEFYLIKNQKKFDSIVDPNQMILKKIWAMCRQPVTIQEKGKPVTKDALYYYGTYLGTDKAGNDIGAEFREGFYLKPKLRFYLEDPANPYDSKTGERKGKYQAAGTTFEHYIFLPENKAERVKFLNDLLDKSPGSTKENVAYGGHLSYRQASPDNNHQGTHGGNFNWDQFCNLSLHELGEVQLKGYYKEEKTGLLKDKDGVRVKFDDNTGKLDAVR